MKPSQLTRIPIAKTGMLIRKPVEHVFEAIVNPEVTAKFWFSKGSGRLETGKPVKWEWESHDVSIEVTPTVVEPNTRVVIEWPGYSGATAVEWTFQVVADGKTFLRVQDSGWPGDADKLLRYAAGSTQGFTLLLAGLKAWLGHGIQLNLTLDRYPKGTALRRRARQNRVKASIRLKQLSSNGTSAAAWPPGFDFAANTQLKL